MANHEAELVAVRKPVFERIGDDGWEAFTTEIIETYAEHAGATSAAPSTADELAAAAERLGVAIPKPLQMFYLRYGTAGVGHQLKLPSDFGWMKDAWAEGYGPDLSDDDKAILPYLVTFSDGLGDGNDFCFDHRDGRIAYFDHEGSPYLRHVLECFDDYLRCCLLLCQTQWEDEDACIEVITEMFGKDVTRAWFY